MKVAVIAGSETWEQPEPIEQALEGAELVLTTDRDVGAAMIARCIAADWDVIHAAVPEAAIAQRAKVELDAGMEVRAFYFAVGDTGEAWDFIKGMRRIGLVTSVVEVRDV